MIGLQQPRLQRAQDLQPRMQAEARAGPTRPASSASTITG